MSAHFPPGVSPPPLSVFVTSGRAPSISESGEEVYDLHRADPSSQDCSKLSMCAHQNQWREVCGIFKNLLELGRMPDTACSQLGTMRNLKMIPALRENMGRTEPATSLKSLNPATLEFLYVLSFSATWTSKFSFSFPFSSASWALHCLPVATRRVFTFVGCSLVLKIMRGNLRTCILEWFGWRTAVFSLYCSCGPWQGKGRVMEGHSRRTEGSAETCPVVHHWVVIA